jgi:hypothetical protein
MGRNSDNNITAEERLAQIKARNAEYARKWRAKNPQKSAEITARYWQRKLERMKEEQST